MVVEEAFLEAVWQLQALEGWEASRGVGRVQGAGHEQRVGDEWVAVGWVAWAEGVGRAAWGGGAWARLLGGEEAELSWAEVWERLHLDQNDSSPVCGRWKRD